MIVRGYSTELPITDFCSFDSDLIAIATGMEVRIVSRSNQLARRVVGFSNEVLSVRPWGSNLLVFTYSTDNSPWIHLLSHEGTRLGEVFLDCDDVGICSRFIATRKENLIEISNPFLAPTGAISVLGTQAGFTNGYFSESLPNFVWHDKNILSSKQLLTNETVSIELAYEPDLIQIEPSGEIIQTIYAARGEYFTTAELTRVAPIPVNRINILSWAGDLERQRVFYSTFEGVFCFDLATASSRILDNRPSYSIQIAKGDHNLLAEFGTESGGSLLQILST